MISDLHSLKRLLFSQTGVFKVSSCDQYLKPTCDDGCDHMHVPRLHMIYWISTRCNTLQSRYYSACPITLGSSDTVLIIEKMLKCFFQIWIHMQRNPPSFPQQKNRNIQKYLQSLYSTIHLLCVIFCAVCI